MNQIGDAIFVVSEAFIYTRVWPKCTIELYISCELDVHNNIKFCSIISQSGQFSLIDCRVNAIYT